jgi:hypothetical protein
MTFFHFLNFFGQVVKFCHKKNLRFTHKRKRNKLDQDLKVEGIRPSSEEKGEWPFFLFSEIYPKKKRNLEFKIQNEVIFKIFNCHN